MSLLFLVVICASAVETEPPLGSVNNAQQAAVPAERRNRLSSSAVIHGRMGLSESRPPLCPHPYSDCPLLASIHTQEDFAKGIRQSAHWFQIKLAEDAGRMLLSSRRLQTRRRPRL